MYHLSLPLIHKLKRIYLAASKLLALILIYVVLLH